MEGFLSDLQFQPEELSGILDEALTRFEDSNEDVEASWNYLAAGLAAVRASAFEYWVKSGLDVVAKHSIRAYMHQDPISGRAFRKPRGYAGDAVLLDLIYNHPDVAGLLAESGGFGQRMYWAAQKAHSANAVRQRRQLLASEIDGACKRTPKARVLSVACGHLREAEICPAIADGKFAEIVAVDQDRESLATIATRWKGVNILPVAARLSRILKGGANLGKFDLVDDPRPAGCPHPQLPIGSWRQSHGQLHICSWEEDANMAGKARKNSVSRGVSPNWRIRSHWVKFRHEIGFHRHRGRQVARAKSHHCCGRNCNLGISALFLLNRLTGTQVV
jgi:hypothetical protein